LEFESWVLAEKAGIDPVKKAWGSYIRAYTTLVGPAKGMFNDKALHYRYSVKSL